MVCITKTSRNKSRINLKSQKHNKPIYLVIVESDEDNSETTKESSQLVEAEFEYICTTPQDVMQFRERKKLKHVWIETKKVG